MITEGVRTETLYENLKKDYLHSSLQIEELCQKYGINQKRCSRICKDIRKEEGLRGRPPLHKRGEDNI